MKSLVIFVFCLVSGSFSFSQNLINVPADGVESSVGSVTFDAIDFTANAISSDSVHGTLTLGDGAKSYLTCITTRSGRVQINYITTHVKIGTQVILGNFGFENFENCKLVASKIASNPGKKVVFKIGLDGIDQKTGKIISIEWQD